MNREEWIEAEIERMEQAYDSGMPVENKSAARRMLREEWEWEEKHSNADYVYGEDEGEELVTKYHE